MQAQAPTAELPNTPQMLTGRRSARHSGDRGPPQRAGPERPSARRQAQPDISEGTAVIRRPA